MDPVTLVTIFLMFVLAGGGARSVASDRKRKRRLLIKDAIRHRTKVASDVEVSLFDVFWDLGVNKRRVRRLIHGLRTAGAIE